MSPPTSPIGTPPEPQPSGIEPPWPRSQTIQATPAGPCYIGLPQQDLIAQRLARDGAFEPELVALALALLGERPPGVVVDVGANVGSFALPLADRLPRHRLHCFEAQRLVAYQLCGAVALNGLAQVHVHHLAVGAQAGTVDITLPDYRVEGNLGALSLDARINRLRGACSVGAVEAVAMVRLDDLGLEDVRLLKIDVEGMELAVLEGAQALLGRCGWPPVVFESWSAPWYEGHHRALVAWLTGRGYEITSLGDNHVARWVG
jgi:FkbM family methyltransferase